ncbi:MAG: hypothetical protein AB8B91_07935 [Rubripirellula sp.]
MATKITDLLPIPEGTQEPHAYQVFGLEPGEQDAQVISAAVQSTVAKIKSIKETTDAKLWSQAAKVVQQARVTLADPEKKSQLDARFGIISIPDEDPEPAAKKSEQTSDPLAGVLPTADPLAAVLPNTNPMAPVEPVPSPDEAVDTPVVPSMPAGVFGTAPEQVAVADAPAVPVVVQPKKVQRRKKSMLATLFFAAFTLGMIGLIGVLGYFLLYGPGQVAITNSGSGLTISTKTPEQSVDPDVPNAAPPKEFDPVMGRLAGDTPPPKRSLSDKIEYEPMEEEPEPGREPEPEMEPEPSMEPEMTASASPAPAAPPELTDEKIASAAKAIERVRDLIGDANWSEMKTVAETTLEMPMTPEQKRAAETWFEMADLATYYREAIVRAVADLNVGNDFAVTETFRVIIVEKGEDLLVVRYSEKNRSFTFDEFPFSLAHKLASFSMPDNATREAAKAVYQAIAPKATPQHRTESVGWLRAIDAEVEGVDPKRIADAIEEMFANDSQ